MSTTIYRFLVTYDDGKIVKNYVVGCKADLETFVSGVGSVIRRRNNATAVEILGSIGVFMESLITEAGSVVYCRVIAAHLNDALGYMNGSCNIVEVVSVSADAPAERSSVFGPDEAAPCVN